jgi:hypothetical protein
VWLNVPNIYGLSTKLNIVAEMVFCMPPHAEMLNTSTQVTAVRTANLNFINTLPPSVIKSRALSLLLPITSPGQSDVLLPHLNWHL